MDIAVPAATELLSGLGSQADTLVEQLNDAENLNQIARAELRGKVVVRWLKKVTEALSVTPRKLRVAASGVRLGVAVGHAWEKFHSAVLAGTLAALEEVARRMDEHASTLDGRIRNSTSHDFDLEEVVQLVRHGKRVPDSHAAMVTALVVSEFRPRHLSSVSNLSRVQSLTITGSHIVDIQDISSLKELRRLSLSKLDIKDGIPFENLTKMRSISLVGSMGNLNFLDRMTDIEDMFLNVRDVEFPSVGHLKNLIFVDVRNMFIDFSSFKNCKSVSRFTAWDCVVKPSRDVSSIKGLEYVEIRRCDTNIEFLLDLPNLKTLRVRGAAINQFTADSFRRRGVNISVAR